MTTNAVYPASIDVRDTEFSYWVGVDLDDANPAQVADFHRFYHTVHCPEVVSLNPGFLGVTRFELATPGPTHPRFLNIYGLQDEEAARRYTATQARQEPSGYTPRPDSWANCRRISMRAIWRRGRITHAATTQLRPDRELSLSWSDNRPDAPTHDIEGGLCLERYTRFEPLPIDTPTFCIIGAADPQAVYVALPTAVT